MNNQNLMLAALALAMVLVAGFITFFPNPATSNTTDNLVLANLPGTYTSGINAQSESRTANPSGLNTDAIYFATDDATGKRLLSVSGMITKTVSPDQAVIVLAVETLDSSAKESQAENARVSTAVINALKTAGVPDNQIKTVGYTLYEQFQWNETTRKSESTGYQTSHRIQVTLTDLDSVGEVVDAAAQAGSNRVEQVSFSLSNAAQEELRTEALAEAAQNARAKANSIATGLGITLGQVYSASENSNYATPYYYRGFESLSADAGSPAPTTPITAGDVEFSATVSVQFEIA